MSLKNLSLGDDVEVPSNDNLGGGGYILNSGLYKMLIDVAYTMKSKGGATGVVLHLKSADPSVKAQHRQTLWVASKAGLAYFMGGKNKDKKIVLPDMQLFQQICKIAVPGTDPDKLTEEKKMVKIWNFDMRAETPTEVNTLPELKDKPLYVGIRKVRENKRVAKEPGSSVYVDTPDERVFNEIHRVFHPDVFSTEEKDKGADKAVFIETWKKKHTPDFVDDKYKAVGGAAGASGTAGAAATASAAAEVDDDLFDD